mgnify:CR=1 FL=1
MAEADRHLASRRVERRRRLITAALSGAVHVALLVALVTIRPPASEPPAELDPIPVMLAPPPPEPPPPAPEPKADTPTPSPPKKARTEPKKEPPPPKRVVARVRPAPPTAAPIPAAKTAAYGFTEASDGDVAGATTADGGGSGAGGGCNMTRRLQAALRKDRQAQAAMAEAHRGRPIMMWNGDWVRHPSQEGAGLATVREAILWEVGFAPEACKAEAQRGMVLISMNDGPGAARLVVGTGSWRWSDLLRTRGRGQTLRR